MVSLTIIYLYFYYIVQSQTVDCKSRAIKGSVKSKSRKHCNLTIEMLFGKLIILYTLTQILVIKSSEISR